MPESAGRDSAVWLGFTEGDADEFIRFCYRRKFGEDPERIVRKPKQVTLAGPIPQAWAERIRGSGIRFHAGAGRES